MYKTFSGHSVNNLFYQILADALKTWPRGVERRDGKVTWDSPGPVCVHLTNPRNRVLTIPGRKGSFPAACAETLWVLAGRNDIAFLEPYLPRAKDFSDNGKTWRAAYGPRLRGKGFCSCPDKDFPACDWNDHLTTCTPRTDQIKFVVDELRARPESRRAIMSLLEPAVDQDVPQAADFPCTQSLSFMRREGKLDLTVFIRSNDFLWGWCLRGNQRVRLLDGTTPKIKTLLGKEFWVYSKDDRTGKIVPGKAKCFSTGRKKIFRVLFDDGSCADVSGNERFRLSNGKYRRTSDLNSGDSVDSVYFSVDKRGYEMLLNGSSGWKYTHTAMNINQKPELGPRDSHYVSHHKEFNKRDNRPEKLEWIGNDSHIRLHAALANRPGMKEARLRGNKTRWSKPEERVRQAALLEALWKDPLYLESRKPVIEAFRRMTKRKRSLKERNCLSVRAKSNWKIGKYNTKAHRQACTNNILAYNVSEAGRAKSREIGAVTGRANLPPLEDRLIYLAKGQINSRTKESRTKMCKRRILGVFARLERLGLPFTEKNYFKHKPMGTPGWAKATGVYFKNLSEIRSSLGVTNHRVVSVNELGTEETFDLQVEKYHNYVLGNGVIVHNSHINLFEFTVLQELVSMMTKIPLGESYIISNSLHIYEDMESRIENILSIMGYSFDVYDWMSSAAYFCSDYTVPKMDEDVGLAIKALEFPTMGNITAIFATPSYIRDMTLAACARFEMPWVQANYILDQPSLVAVAEWAVRTKRMKAEEVVDKLDLQYNSEPVQRYILGEL